MGHAHCIFYANCRVATTIGSVNSKVSCYFEKLKTFEIKLVFYNSMISLSIRKADKLLNSDYETQWVLINCRGVQIINQLRIFS